MGSAGQGADALAELPEIPPAPIIESKHVDLDLDRLRSLGYLVTGANSPALADEFRVIKRPILSNIAGAEGVAQANRNLVMVTSALPGEGKTFASINLALSIATEMDRTVLLVEADSARPAVLSRFGLPPSPGLLDVLEDKKTALSDVILRTNIEKLWILPAGASRPTATELLASNSMHSLVSELSRRYRDRVIIFDTPPLLPSPESRVLATNMGQIVMLVEASKTTRASVNQALATLEACPVVMLMLNKSRLARGTSYGSYGY
jgi:receptor protein-tyrosine kinase